MDYQQEESHIYLQLSGVQGSCERTDSKNWIALTGFSQSFSRGMGTGSDAVKGQHHPISVSALVDKSTSYVLQQVMAGQKYPTATIKKLTDAGGTSKEALKIDMKEVAIESFSYSVAPQGIFVNFSLSYDTIELTFKHAPDYAAAMPASWNLKTGKKA